MSKFPLTPASLSKLDYLNKSLSGDANYIKNPDMFPDPSVPQTGCSGTASNVVAATGKFIQQPRTQMGGNYAERLIPNNYPNAQHVGLSSPRQGYPTISSGKHNEIIVRDLDQYNQQFVNTLSGGKGKSRRYRKNKNNSTKSSYTYRGSKKNNKKNTNIIKKGFRSYKKTMKRMKNKTIRFGRRGMKMLKNKTKHIRLRLSRKKYRGGVVLPTFINEFNTTLTPNESGMASPTPLTRTYGDCTYIAN
jgi:hypothetical protein